MINKKFLFLSLAAGLMGGMLTNGFLRPQLAWAYSSLFGDKLQIFNPRGTMVADLFAPREGGGVMDLYSEEGGMRVQIGSYGSGGEKGLPLVGLSDNNAQLRFLIRLAGSNQSPVLIFKDRSGRDRMVMGLDLSGSDEEPFLATFEKSGKKKLVFGKY